MSSPGFGGMNLVIIITALGFLGLLVSIVFLLAFFAVLGYYLYKLERRISGLEGGPSPAGGSSANKPRQN